ncbi:peptidylprolyl isomerase [Oscillatoriales cyanobacterium USR001]|nr:peptidylprolyl isomerase [Oscillatoriales cyanobacterium USR001]
MKITIQRWLLPLLVIAVIAIAGCDNSSATSSSSTPSPVASESVSPSPVTQASNSQLANLPRLEGKATVVMVVKGSPITIEVDGTNAPITAGNFVDLVKRGVYDGLKFHRVIREPQPFVAQGGDPQGKDPKFPVARLGTGGFIDPVTSKERYIPLEIKPKSAKEPIYSMTLEQAGVNVQPVLKHTRGAIAMARANPPDSASSQFYFALSDLPFLDGSYAVFGYVTQGMEIVDKIEQNDRIDSAKVTQGLENLKS